MITHQHKCRLTAIFMALSMPLTLVQSVSADSGGIGQAQNFIKALTGDLALLAGAIAGLFLVYGGLLYATASNNPEHMEGSKNTMKHFLLT